MNKEEYTKCIEDDIAFLERHLSKELFKCLWCSHIKDVLRESISLLYDQPSLPSDADEAAEQAMPASYSSLEVDIYGGSEPVYSYEQMVEMFKAGVAYDRAKMLEEAVEIGETNIYWEIDGDRAFPTLDPPAEDLLMPGIISQKFNDGDKVRIVVLKAEEE